MWVRVGLDTIELHSGESEGREGVRTAGREGLLLRLPPNSSVLGKLAQTLTPQA